MPRVSVILPTFNDLEYLKLALDSALNQTYRDYELLVVDDGSNDGTKEYLATLENPCLRVFHKENGGCYDAINYGIERAQGELVTWISSDNLCPVYFLDALVMGIDSEPGAKLAYASYFVIDAEGSVYAMNIANHQFPNEMLTHSSRGTAAFIYQKDCHNTVGPYIASPSCDTDMWIKLASSFDQKSVYIIEPLYFYRMHDRRGTNRLPKNYMRETLATIFTQFEKLHHSKDLISKIYPKTISLKDAYLTAMAFNDIAIRYVDQGLHNHALMFWRAGLSLANKPALRALIHNLAEAFAKHRIESSIMLAQIETALKKNKNIIDTQYHLSRALDIYNNAKVEGFCGYIIQDQMLTHEYAKRFVCFSYHASKAGICQKSLVPFVSVRP
jgi:glycosyltransferase involved in cell wall biosynthesis